MSDHAPTQIPEQAAERTSERALDGAPEVTPRPARGPNPVVQWLEGVRKGSIPGGPL